MAASELDSVKEARRRKIRQLEASLFGATGIAGDEATTGLPELQRVNEYAAQFGHAEQRKNKTNLPSLQRASLDNLTKRSIFGSDHGNHNKDKKKHGKKHSHGHVSKYFVCLRRWGIIVHLFIVEI